MARLVWLNGPPFVGKRTLARLLRDEWGVFAFDAEAIGFVLAEGTPARQAPGALQDFGAWLWCLWRIGVEMARHFEVVVMPACVYRPDLVGELIGEFHRASVEVTHVVLEAADVELLRRIHGHDVEVEAKRWALEQRRPAVAGLERVHDRLRLDTTGRNPHQVAAALAQALVGQGWLTDDLAWVPPVPPGTAGRPSP